MTKKFSKYFPNMRGTSPIKMDIAVDLGDLLDANGNDVLTMDAVASSVNNIAIANAATSGAPAISVVGSDTNAGLTIDGKGSGVVSIASVSTGGMKVGTSTAEAVPIKGIYYATVSVTVPSITDPDIAKVDVDVSSAFTIQPAVGDFVIVTPIVALPTNARLQGAWVTATDSIQITYGSEGGNVTGAAKNHSILVIDVT